MTIPEFVGLLRSTPRDWRLEHGTIRRGSVGCSDLRTKQCPIFAVAGPGWNMKDGMVSEAAACIGLEQEDFWNLLDAADNATGGNRNAKVGPLRKQLLEACGLKEE